MRKSWLAFALGVAALTACSGYDRDLLGDPEPERPAPAQVAAAPTEEYRVEEPADSLEMFDDLRFYGSWYDLYPYGSVWRPMTVADWSPMTYGHWAWTSYGWMWISYEPFGWATYSYGFWVNDFSLGWVWVPDYAWEPARCEWIVWDDYVGWCPLPPPNVRYKDPWGYDTGSPWVTVPVARFKDAQVADNRVQPRFKAGSSERTMRRSAPDANTIERGLGHSLKAVDVRLDQSMFGSRELTRVVLPVDEQAFVDQRKAEARYRTPKPPATSTGLKSTPRDSGGSDSNERSKEKSTPPASQQKKESNPGFKEKAKGSSDSSKGSSDKSKDSSKNPKGK